MSTAPSHVQVLARLQQARDAVAHGAASIAIALAWHPISTAQRRVAEAAGAPTDAPPWVLVLSEALRAVAEARTLWGAAPDTMPPMTSDLAPCGKELRLHLPDARHCAELGLAWEDPGGLSRPQALCVLHLAVCLAQWRALEQRADSAAAQAQAELNRQRQQRAAVAAKAIWGTPAKPAEPERGPRSLRDLAAVSAAFDQWSDEETDEA